MTEDNFFKPISIFTEKPKHVSFCFMRLTFIIFFGILFLSTPALALTLTGDVEADFGHIKNCVIDSEDPDMAIPPVFTNSSGLDIYRVCFYYDGEEDSLSIGIEAVDNRVFGDVDGDGDPAFSSIPGFVDYADWGSTETFVLSFDADSDSAGSVFDHSTVDFMVGVSPTETLAELAVFEPSAAFDADNPSGGFGLVFDNAVTVFASPHLDARDLEFFINNFSDLVGEILAPAPRVYLQAFAASIAGGVGADFLPETSSFVSHPLYDFDEDGLLDWEEIARGTDPSLPDTDDGGVSDKIEVDYGSDPLDPSDDDDVFKVSGQSGLSNPFDQAQGGGATCAFSEKAQKPKHPVSSALVLAMILVLWRIRRRLRNRDFQSPFPTVFE